MITAPTSNETLAKAVANAASIYPEMGTTACELFREAAARLHAVESLAAEFAESGFPGFAARLRGEGS